MSRKNKNKPKKISAKKEKYKKFRKDKPAMDISMPDLDAEKMKQARDDELRINKFLRFSKNKAPSEVNPRRAKSKR